jgi:hypothetical protein
MKNLTLFTQIRTHLFIGKLTLAAILVLSVIGQVSAQQSNILPVELSDFSITPSTIDTTNSSQSVTVTVRVTNAITDVSKVKVGFRSLTGNQFVYVSLDSSHRISGNARDGIYSAAAIFPQYSKAGMWQVFEIRVYDSLSNYRNFSGTELVARGITAQLQVISNNEDLTPPEISDFSFTPSAIDTTNGSQTVTVTVRVTDAKAGVSSVSAGFSPAGADYYHPVSMNRISGDDKDGVYRGVYTFGQDTPSGLYDVYVSAYDLLGNGKSVYSAELAERGYPSQLQIKSARAAIVSVAGRVTTANRRGISRALIRMTDGKGVVRATYTNSFGYYSFADVEVGQTVIFDVRSKRYNFTQPTQVVSLDGNSSRVNFTAY